MTKFDKYFSKDYFSAKKKFKNLTKNLACQEKKITKNLTINFALSKSGNKTLIMFISGTHGVEGYIGSAVQLYIIDKYLKKINSIFDVAFVHSLNPFGFKNNRRYNENNVDLNRNNIKNYKDKKIIDNNKKILEYPLFNPKRERRQEFLEKIEYYFEVLSSVKKRGLLKTINVIGFGQSLFPKGVCFIGKEKQKSIMYLEDYIQEVTKNYDNFILVDLHTGASKKYKLDVYFTKNKNKEFLNLFKKIKDISQNKYNGLDHIGGLENILKISNAKDNQYMLFEFGTINRFSTVLSLNYLSYLLVKENQIYNFGPKEKILKIKNEMKNAYSPSTYKYKKFILKQIDLIFKNL
jgi:hypothetical protein